MVYSRITRPHLQFTWCLIEHTGNFYLFIFLNFLSIALKRHVQKGSSHLHCSACGRSTGPHWAPSTAHTPLSRVHGTDLPLSSRKKLVCPNGISHNSLLRDGEMSRSELWALFSCIVSAACERSVQCACHTLWSSGAEGSSLLIKS